MISRLAQFYQGQAIVIAAAQTAAGATPHWSRDYVGLPWQFAGRSREGVDCWGLLWLVYRDVLGIEVTSYAQETMDAPEREQIAALLNNDRQVSPWLDVQHGSERPFDMAVFRRGGIDSHVGVVVEPGRMLHITNGTESRVERFDQGRWKPKLVAIHHHENR
jgi:cell wall-associated NlpC family hydrolase